jgi:hypothetical protein
MRVSWELFDSEKMVRCKMDCSSHRLHKQVYVDTYCQKGTQRIDFNEMIKTTVHLLEKHDIRFDNSCRIFVDAANPSFISTLKQAVNEDPDYLSSSTSIT